MCPTKRMILTNGHKISDETCMIFVTTAAKGIQYSQHWLSTVPVIKQLFCQSHKNIKQFRINICWYEIFVRDEKRIIPKKIETLIRFRCRRLPVLKCYLTFFCRRVIYSFQLISIQLISIQLNINILTLRKSSSKIFIRLDKFIIIELSLSSIFCMFHLMSIT